ncbi:MAG: hypothetical protein IJ223_00225 [Clostridia bacterium]|nr:hypothetical protein [Clostridia bacterium]
MSQQEYFNKVNGLLDELLDSTKSISEKHWRTNEYANALEELIRNFHNDETFNFMLGVQRRIYEYSKKHNYGNEGVILVTTYALGSILGGE